MINPLHFGLHWVINKRFCLQWGRQNIKTDLTVTFPVAFMNVYVIVVGCYHDSATSRSVKSSTITKTGFSTTSANSAIDIVYVATGRK